jgi:hypothetical protein
MKSVVIWSPAVVLLNVDGCAATTPACALAAGTLVKECALG